MGRASERRTERVKSLLLSAISDIMRDELSDPRLGITSLSEISLTPDLAHAEVLIVTVGGEAATASAADVLNRAAPLIWNRLRDETDLRAVPKLRFSADTRGKYADEIFQLLQTIPPYAEDEAAEDDTTGAAETGAPTEAQH